ncbi:MAG: hypothetical protein ACAH24_09300 [Hyphomicrobiaceae bacterium]|jgi:hypothetical protein
MTLPFLRPLIAAILLTGSALAAGAQDFATYRNERHGFSLSYPAGTFAEGPSPSADGGVFVSRDGNARLLAGALPNDGGMGLRDYRAFVLKQSYPDAAIDYAPVRDSWFVLSGTRDGMMFYERVTFTCGGRLINSWAMLYPATERQVYDRIVEQVARTYRPGAASCG